MKKESTAMNLKEVGIAPRESEVQYGELVESVNSIIMRMDLKGNITFFNRFAREFFGFEHDEIIGRNVIGTIVPETEKAMHGVKTMLGNIGRWPRRYANREHENIRKNGERVWIAWTNKAIFDKEGEISEIFCVGNDITALKYHESLLKKCRNRLDKLVKMRTEELTKANEELQQEIVERKWMEDILRNSEEKYRLVVENANEGIVVNQDGFFKYINAKAAKIFGRSEEILTSRPFIEFIHPEDRDMVTDRYLRRLKGETFPHVYSCRIIDGEGTVKWIEINSVLIAWMGRPATLAFFSNITERKRAEEKVMTYQERLQSLASELSLAEERERRRIATELHDHIGQTLAMTKIKLGALRDSLTLCGCAEQIDDIRGLIEKTIQYTKSLTFELSPPTLYELGFVATVEWLAEQMQKQHYILFDFEDDGKPKPLDKDIGILMFQAVRELFMNIVKHAQAHQVKVAIRSDNGEMRISVEDDGIGFDPSKIDRTKAFGFFSIRERVRHLGGAFEIDSSPGHGTRVVLTTPFKLDRKRRSEDQ